MSKKHPYDYVNSDNFDIIRGCIVQGLTLQKKPWEIVQDLQKVVGFPEDVCVAIVSQEVGQAFDGWKNSQGPPIK